MLSSVGMGLICGHSLFPLKLKKKKKKLWLGTHARATTIVTFSPYKIQRSEEKIAPTLFGF